LYEDYTDAAQKHHLKRKIFLVHMRFLTELGLPL